MMSPHVENCHTDSRSIAGTVKRGDFSGSNCMSAQEDAIAKLQDFMA
ncbi:MAG: hypothetical protein HC903_23535, partial [Methylacidiphilales bacterium]|nr:hypothetical protein [Candidatus Methylacidiphilales bacterium]